MTASSRELADAFEKNERKNKTTSEYRLKTLSTGQISIHWIARLISLTLIHWIVIYPMDSAIQRLINPRLQNSRFFSQNQ